MSYFHAVSRISNHEGDSGMTKTAIRLTCALLVVASLVATPAAAQMKPRLEVSASYGFLADSRASLNTTTDRPAMNGWTVDIARGVGRFSVVGELDQSYGREPGDSAYGIDNTWHDVNLLAGVRFSKQSHIRVRPFIQFLGGMFRTDQHYTSTLSGNRYLTTTYDVAIQPGAGVDVMLTERVGIKCGADLKILPNYDWSDATAGTSMFRMRTGVVVKLGAKP
jgi:hypothetical protein